MLAGRGFSVSAKRGRCFKKLRRRARNVPSRRRLYQPRSIKFRSEINSNVHAVIPAAVVLLLLHWLSLLLVPPKRAGYGPRFSGTGAYRLLTRAIRTAVFAFDISAIILYFQCGERGGTRTRDPMIKSHIWAVSNGTTVSDIARQIACIAVGCGCRPRDFRDRARHDPTARSVPSPSQKREEETL